MIIDKKNILFVLVLSIINVGLQASYLKKVGTIGSTRTNAQICEKSKKFYSNYILPRVNRAKQFAFGRQVSNVLNQKNKVNSLGYDNKEGKWVVQTNETVVTSKPVNKINLQELTVPKEYKGKRVTKINGLPTKTYVKINSDPNRADQVTLTKTDAGILRTNTYYYSTEKSARKALENMKKFDW